MADEEGWASSLSSLVEEVGERGRFGVVVEGLAMVLLTFDFVAATCSHGNQAGGTRYGRWGIEMTSLKKMRRDLEKGYAVMRTRGPWFARVPLSVFVPIQGE